MAAGDFHIRRNNADVTSVPNAGVGNEDAGWDTVVYDEGTTSIVTYTDPNLQLNIGTYLIMYSEYFSTTDTTNNERIEIQGEIHDGAGVIGGYGQGYIRKSSGDQECVVRGQVIHRVTANNTNIFTRFYRTDNSTTGTVDRVPGNGGITILELDDTNNFGWYSTSASRTSTGTESTINFDTNDRQDTGFSNASGVITFTNAGRYLVEYDCDGSQSTTGREDYNAWLTLNGTATIINGTHSYTYLRGTDGCQDGALSNIAIIDIAASDTIQVRTHSPTSGTFTIPANEGRLRIWQIPTAGDETIIEATTGDYNAAGVFAWDTNPYIDAASFTHTAGQSNLDIDQRDHILAFASLSQLALDTPQRAVPFLQFDLDGTVQNYACADVYHRNTALAGEVAVNLAALVHSTAANSSLSVNITPKAASGSLINDHGSFSALSLVALGYKTYTFPPLVTDFNTTNNFDWGSTSLVVTGADFEATQGTGKVEIWDDAVGTTKVAQTVNTWAAGSINIDVVQGALPTNSNLYMVVTTNSGLTSNTFLISEGIAPYTSVVLTTNPDHYWRLNNVYSDTGITGPVRDMTSQVVGTFSFLTTQISEDSTHCLQVNSVTQRREIVDSANMNVTITSSERTLSCWIQLGGIQKSFGTIWKEGGGVQNLAFMVGMGNVLLAQMADTPGLPGNVQAWSDIKLTPNRPYHICMRYSLSEPTREFRLYLDGEEQTETNGNPMGTGTFNTHSGDVVWFDSDTNLETGGVDVAYAGQENLLINHFGTWSDNSTGPNAGALDKVTEIRDILFRRGANPKYTISQNTQTAMQTDLDTQLASTVVPDWPLGIRIEPPTGGGDLELIADNITFDSRTTMQIEWRGTGTLTWVNKNGSATTASKLYASRGSTITVVEAVPVKVTVKDINTKALLQNARVLVYADTGGPLPSGDSVTITRVTTTATVAHTAHGLLDGTKVIISGATQDEYNGIKTITVTGANAYTYTVSGSPTTPATGTITSTAVILDGATTASGVVEDTIRYSSSQPMLGRVRYAAGLYKTAGISATATSIGFDGEVLLIPDN